MLEDSLSLSKTKYSFGLVAMGTFLGECKL